MKNTPIVLALLAGILILGVANGGGSVMHLFVMKYKLAPNNYEALQVVMTAVLGGGMLIGSLISVRLAKKVPLYIMIIVSFFISAAVFLLQSLIAHVESYLVLYFAYALSIPLCNVAFFGWLAQVTERGMMGRVHALIQPIMMVTFAAMQGFIAISFPAWIPVEAIFYIVGGSQLLLAFFYLLTLPALAQKQLKSKVSMAKFPA